MCRFPRLSTDVRALAILAILALVAVAGCGGDDDDDDAGGTSTTATTASTTTSEDPTAAIEAEILEAYQAQWDDYVRAGDPPTPDAPYLSDHQTGKVLAGTVGVLEQRRAEGVGIRGYYETDARVAELTDTTAVVEDCGLDQTESFRLDTGEVVGTSDDERDGLIANMVLTDGAWKVESFERNEELCDR